MEQLLRERSVNHLSDEQRTVFALNLERLNDLMDGRGLATGLLLIRAAGETFAASQAVTLLE